MYKLMLIEDDTQLSKLIQEKLEKQRRARSR
jgi:hypothetical protein